MDDVIPGRSKSAVTGGGFLVKVELFLMHGWVSSPPDQVDCVDFVSFVIPDDRFVSKGCLQGVHPVGMDNGRMW